MRKRIISAAVVLGLGMVGIALAQQAGQQPKDHVSEREKLRAQVAKLRAEVELLDLEHQADKAVVVSVLKEERDSESESGRVDKAREAVSEATMMAASLGKLEEFKKEFGDEKAMQASAEKELKEKAESNRAEGQLKKQVFVRRATELAEKRLELAEVEKQYNEAK
jgi:hypothetical protein